AELKVNQDSILFAIKQNQLSDFVFEDLAPPVTPCTTEEELKEPENNLKE
ncbi:unnamed protein product, partial [Allacma fusca]